MNSVYIQAGAALCAKRSYNNSMRYGLLKILCTGLLTLAMTAACTPAPGPEDIRGAISGHFERRGFMVLELEIGEVAPVELARKTYMGTPGFIVNIKRITLVKYYEKSGEKSGQKPGGNAEAVRHVFTDARVRLREDPADRALWRVYIISGIDPSEHMLIRRLATLPYDICHIFSRANNG